MGKLHLVYDFASRSTDWDVMLLPLLLVAAGAGMFYYYLKVVPSEEVTRLGFSKRKTGLIFSAVYTAFALVFPLVIIPAKLTDYATTQNIYTTHAYKTVAGKVTQYHPMPEGGHDTERFEVAGVPFAYSDYDLTDFGYNNAASKGGAIKPDLFVRIGYFNNGRRNVILKLETE